MHGINSRLELTEERVCDPEAMSIEIIQSKEQREEKIKKIIINLTDSWDNKKQFNVCNYSPTERRLRERNRKANEELVAKYFPNLIKTTYRSRKLSKVQA